MDAVLHIGPHKTGTSSIQHAMRNNVANLEQQGFLTASDGENAASALPLPFQSETAFNPTLRRKHKGWAEAVAWAELQWLDLEQAAKDRPDHTMILSSEHFSSLADPSPLIARMRRTFDRITVIAYVRDPVDLYVSSLQQNIRAGRRLVELRIPSESRFAIRKQISKFAAEVGAQNIMLRNFARTNLAGGDVVTDFFETVSRLGRPVTVSSSFVNEAYPAPIIGWLLAMNENYERTVETMARIALVKRLDSVAELKSFPKLRLDVPDFEATIRARSRDDCLWLNETFLQGQDQLRVDGSAKIADYTETDERTRLRGWILKDLTPEAISLLLAATIDLQEPTSPDGISRRKGKPQWGATGRQASLGKQGRPGPAGRQKGAL